MNTAKRALIKLAIVGTLAGGMVGVPMAASAQAEPNHNNGNCFGAIISTFASADHPVNPAMRFSGGDPTTIGEKLVDVRARCD